MTNLLFFPSGMSTLLLTGTIKPSPNILFLNITDATTRYTQYVQSIIRYLCFSDAESIVFCENSGVEIPDAELLSSIAHLSGKKLEILQFQGNHEKSVEKGRGFGENEIIEYAIAHSALIKDSGTFIKITGRYRCENINQIIQGSIGKEICFSKLMPVSRRIRNTKAINTALFKTSIGFFNEVLAGAGEEVDDSKIIFLEHVYFPRLNKVAKKISPLPQYPKMRGVTGQGTLLKKSAAIEIAMSIVHKIGITTI